MANSNLQITIYTIAFNEELMLPHFIRHYRARFHNCKIIVYDNQSTDGTVLVAKSAGCEVIEYNTNNQLSDSAYLRIKNHCWQTTPRLGWALIADVDELCDINEADLLREQKAGTTIVTFKGYNMVNLREDYNVEGITHGVPDDMYSKHYLFYTPEISAINYNPGCHVSKPVGRISYSTQTYNCYHYRYINTDYVVNRYAVNLKRLSAENKRKGWGSQYASGATKIVNEIAALRKHATQLRRETGKTNLTIYVAGFESRQLDRVPDMPHLKKVNLSKVISGPLQNNALSEHRLHLAATHLQPASQYVGIATWRWHIKCRHLIQLNQLKNLYLQPNRVYAAWPDKEWYRHSIISHPGIKPYLDELAEFTGLSTHGTGIYGNQFICHISEWHRFMVFFKRCFEHFHAKYGYNKWNFEAKEEDMPRLPAIFYERIAAIYFANRTNLEIVPIPKAT